MDGRINVGERCARAAAEFQNVHRSKNVGFAEIAGPPALGNRCPRCKMKYVTDTRIVERGMCDIAITQTESDDTASIQLEEGSAERSEII
jgi:hypothetical protein